MGDEPILRVEGITKRFGGVTALDGLSFAVEAGSITSLIGPNGAGKTTALNVIAQMTPADAGEVFFGGRRITGLAPAQVARLGLLRTFQTLRIFRRLTVLENVLLGIQGQRGEALWHAVLRPVQTAREAAAVRSRAVGVLEYLGLDGLAEERAERLSYGEQKLLALALALAGDGVLVMLDEPCAGLHPELVHRVLGFIRDLVRRAKTVVLIEHDMDVVSDLSDHVIVLNEGRLLVGGRPDTIADDPRVREVYLGGAVGRRWPSGSKA